MPSQTRQRSDEPRTETEQKEVMLDRRGRPLRRGTD